MQIKSATQVSSNEEVWRECEGHGKTKCAGRTLVQLELFLLLLRSCFGLIAFDFCGFSAFGRFLIIAHILSLSRSGDPPRHILCGRSPLIGSGIPLLPSMLHIVSVLIVGLSYGAKVCIKSLWTVV